MSLLINELERYPHSPILGPKDPLVNFLSCAADSAPDMPRGIKKAVHRVEDSLASKSGKVDEKALDKLVDWWVDGSSKDGMLAKGLGKAMVTTTQAVDIISGGVKVNALVRYTDQVRPVTHTVQPEVVTAVVNHRINIISSVVEVQERFIDTLSPIVSKMNLSMTAFGKDVEVRGCPAYMTEAKAGKVTLEVPNQAS